MMCLWLVLLAPTLAVAQDVVGCGGFIQSTIDMDFSQVEVKLYTKQGAHKYTADCAPNGYFLIPLYDKGSFVIKVESSRGWSFRPESVEVIVDGETDPCSLGEDINFVFSGVSLSGRVISQGQLVGPSGVKLSLLSDGEVVVEGKTKESGQYYFPHILPGKYVLKASHPVWSFLSFEVNVNVQTDSVKVNGDIQVSGYDVTGYIENAHGLREGAKFILIPTERTIIPGMSVGCENLEISTEMLEILLVPNGEKPVCVAISNADGVFEFKSLPTGTYTVYPYFETSVKFEVKPSVIAFEVGHSSVVLDMLFRVIGFTVYGQVLHSKDGKGMLQAAVSVHGFATVHTDSSGQFHLNGITPGKYTFDVAAKDVFFETTKLDISSENLHLPTFFPALFNLCGSVIIDSLPNQMEKMSNRRVSILSQTGMAVHPSTVALNEVGDFCFRVPPGEYVLRPILTSVDVESGLALAPAEIQATITDQPVKGLKFSQFQAVLSGAVQCLGKEKCDKIAVSLRGIGGSKYQSQGMTSGDGKFVFKGVLPGKYEVSVVKDNWCWKEHTVSTLISDKDIVDVLFVQSGYTMPYISSHTAKMHYKHSKDNKTTGSFDLVKGMGRLCLTRPGQYILTLVSCHKFEQDQYEFNTRKPTVVQLSATQHQVTGTVISTEATDELMLAVYQAEGDSPVMTVNKVTKGSEIKGQERLFVYQYVFLSAAGQIKIVPQLTDFLFRPQFKTVNVRIDDCTDRVQPFHGSRGIYIEGQISPPVSEVTIHLVIEDEVHNLSSNDKGQYRYGPVDRHTKYTVSASKDGYDIVPDERVGDFKATKLGFISVRIHDTEGQPLSGVLLSLTGRQYRNNSITGETGIITYTHLPPGQYFARPLLKEYDFMPGSQSIDVEKETESTVDIIGRQVAFSCYGRVMSLNQLPETGINVLAIGLGDCSEQHEETQTGMDGHFRLRGLKPGCQFIIEVEKDTGPQRIVKSLPDKEVVTVGSGDLLDINIIVIRATGEFELSGNVITLTEYLQSLRVNLYVEGHQDSPIHTIILGSSSFFYFPMIPADGRSYVLELESHLSLHSYYYSLPSTTFTTAGHHKHVTFEFRPTLKSTEVEPTGKGSIVVLVALAMTVVVILMNQEQISGWVVRLPDRMSGNGTVDRQNGEYMEVRQKTTRRKVGN